MWDENGPEFYGYLKDHFIIFCQEEHLWEFMEAFNSYSKDIIYFVSDKHPSNIFEVVRKRFNNLIYLECMYSDIEELKKLNLEEAAHVFIVSWAVGDTCVADSGILPLVKQIEENFSGCKYTLELNDELNMRYLKNRQKAQDSRLENVPYRLWPKFAKSDILFSSSLDGLLAITFYNPGLLDVIMKLIGLDINSQNYQKENDRIVSYRYIGENTIRYDKIFKFFISMEESIIPIAIYRYDENPYVVTNPKRETSVNQFDQIICIGSNSKGQIGKFDKTEYIEDSIDKLSIDNDEEDISKQYGSKNNLARFKTETIAGKQNYDELNEVELIQKLRVELENYSKRTANDQTINNSSVNITKNSGNQKYDDQQKEGIN